MNVILLTVLALSGADPALSHGDDCRGCGNGQPGNLAGGLKACCGPMPQSCYNPSFGCYPSTRFMHRYPAFHNYYYRSAYNYRHYFEYPWHAGMHEPTPMFSYHAGGATLREIGAPPIPLAFGPHGPSAGHAAPADKSVVAPSSAQR